MTADSILAVRVSEEFSSPEAGALDSSGWVSLAEEFVEEFLVLARYCAHFTSPGGWTLSCSAWWRTRCSRRR
jgi:hypothetical protein